MSTIRDVARLAGVSAGTVSNVLNRPSYVAAETRRRVREAMVTLDFAPTTSARQFRPGRGRTLGLAVADMGNPFFVDIAMAADAEARRMGAGVVIVTNAEDAVRQEQNLDLLIQQRVHGILISPVNEPHSRLAELAERGVPLVYIDRVSGDRPCCWVTTDNRTGGQLAARHLVERGHHRLGFVGGDAITRQVEQRFDGFTDAAQAGGATVERIATTWWSLSDGREAARLVSERAPADRPTALLCANDLIALGLLQELTRLQVRVPHDVSLVGFDDLQWAASSVVPLTSVRQPRDQLGSLAIRLLMDEIDRPGMHVHEHRLLTPELVVRESSDLHL